MSGHGMQSFQDAIGKLMGHAEMQRLIEAGKQVEEDAPVELVCPRCKGAGWLRLDLPPGAHDFGRIVECRCGLVAARRSERFLGASKIPAEYADLGLETYPDRLIAADVRNWWRDAERPWLLLIGDYGVGKTGLAIGLVKLALADGQPAVFRVVPDLLSEIRATYSSRDASAPAEADLVGALKTADLLALDDLGAERMTGWVEERLFEILNYRYNERRRTIITTNLGPDDLSDHVGERIFWRITGMGWRYEIVGRNLRLRADRPA